MEHLAFIGSGFAIVIAVLASLWGVCVLVGLGFKDRKSNTAQKQEPFEGVPPQHVAAISAVLAQVMDSPYRVVSVSAPAHRSLAWEEEGRFEQAAAHRVRWNWNAIPETRPNLKREP